MSEVEEMRDYVEDRCARDNLTDSDKSSLKSSLTRLINHADRQKDGFDIYIEKIEEFIEDYDECKVDEPITP